MGLRGGKDLKYGTVATFWKANEVKGKTVDAQISISKKNKQTDQYETDFSGFVRFCGDAMVEFVKGLKEKDKIEIESFELTNHYDKEKKVTYTNVSVFAAKMADFNNSGTNAPSNAKKDDSFMNIPDSIADSELPFN